MSSRATVVIPTFNNVGTIADVVARTLSFTRDLLVVNDGSTDGTREAVAARPEVHLVNLERNQGKGIALQTGFRRARELGYDHAITLDADGQHDPAFLPAFLDAIARHPQAIIIGARDMTGEHITWKSTWGLRCSNLGVQILTGLTLPDTQSGYRAYPLQSILELGARGSRFDFEVEVLVRAARAGVPIRSVPVSVHYPSPEERVTHFRPVRDFLRVMALDFRLLAEPRRRRRPRATRSVSPGTGCQREAPSPQERIPGSSPGAR